MTQYWIVCYPDKYMNTTMLQTRTVHRPETAQNKNIKCFKPTEHNVSNKICLDIFKQFSSMQYRNENMRNSVCLNFTLYTLETPQENGDH